MKYELTEDYQSTPPDLTRELIIKKGTIVSHVDEEMWECLVNYNDNQFWIVF